ncbi:hypothetical protein KKF84_20065, partial [Myxococcota bacterium]|nr:hypothetical protein [Myxococcota bacterium]MBU1537621.1 hypothetical protein [Myxococcota bacterium]
HYKTWLSDETLYKRWRALVLGGRVIAVGGDLTKAVALGQVAAFLKKIGMNLGVVYFSNAEEYWGTYHKPFRKAIIAMPAGSKSVVLRGTFMRGHDQADNLYHYSVQSLTDFAAWMKIPHWMSATYMVRIGKKLLKGTYFSRIEGPTPERLKVLTDLIKKIRAQRKKRHKNK